MVLREGDKAPDFNLKDLHQRLVKIPIEKISSNILNIYANSLHSAATVML